MGDNSRRKGNPFWELQQHFRNEKSSPGSWELMSFFMKVSDRSLQVITGKNGKKFPAGKTYRSLSASDTHPVLLLKRIGNYNYRFCPCSTKNYSDYSYIPAGSKLVLAPTTFPNNGYICHDILIGLPRENNIVTQENFFGIVRENDIVGDQYKEGMQ
jgi:hypothetical protein